MEHTLTDVRQGTIADLDQLAPLFDEYRQFYGRSGDLERARSFLHERFAHQESVIFVALLDDQGMVGFVQLYPSFSSVAARRTLILSDLFVAPAARRCGIGARLVEAAIDYGRAVGALRLTLATALDNEPAQALYLKQAWQRETEFCLLHYPLRPA